MEAPIPAPPGHLSRRAKAFWRSVAEVWELSPVHQELLRRACEMLARQDQAREVLDQEGLTVSGSKGQPVPHPALAAERDAGIRFLRIVREMNLGTADPDDSRPPGRDRRYRR